MSKKNPLLKYLKYVLFFGLGTLIFYLLLRGQDWTKIGESIQHIDYRFIAICFVATILSHYVRAVRWNMLIDTLGFKVSALNSFVAVMTGYFANLALPRMGEISRCVVLNRTNKVPVEKLIGTVVVERIVDVIALLILSIMTFALEFTRLEGFINKYILSKFNGQQTGSTTSNGNGLLYGILILFFVGMIGLFVVFKIFKNNPFVLKIKSLIQGFGDGLQSIWKMENKWKFIGLSILLWFCYYLMVYFCFFSLEITSHLGLLAALTVLTLGSYGFVAPVQGGIGAYHWVVIQTLLMYGLNEQDGFTFALVAHSFQTLAIILLGAISFMCIGFLIPKEDVLAPTIIEIDPSIRANENESLESN